MTDFQTEFTVEILLKLLENLERIFQDSSRYGLGKLLKFQQCWVPPECRIRTLPKISLHASNFKAKLPSFITQLAKPPLKSLPNKYQSLEN